MSIIPERLACSTVTFRHYELAAALDAVSGLGFASVDLGALAGLCEHVPPAGDAMTLAATARTVRASGLHPVSVNADAGSFNAGLDAQQVLGRVARLSDFCADAGVPALVLTSGEPEQSADTPSDQIARVGDGLNRAHAIARDRGITLVVEAPHNFRLVNTLPRVRLLMASLDPEIRQVWDVSHVRAAGESPSGALREFLEAIEIVHLRDAVPGDIRRFIGGGDIDFGRFIAETESAGFRGPYVLELETHNSPYETKEAEVQAALDILRPALDEAGIAETRNGASA